MGEGLGVELVGEVGGIRVGVDAHGGEVGAELILHLLLDVALERKATALAGQEPLLDIGIAQLTALECSRLNGSGLLLLGLDLLSFLCLDVLFLFLSLDVLLLPLGLELLLFALRLEILFFLLRLGLFFLFLGLDLFLFFPLALDRLFLLFSLILPL